jgi:hypothetical protein
MRRRPGRRRLAPTRLKQRWASAPWGKNPWGNNPRGFFILSFNKAFCCARPGVYPGFAFFGAFFESFIPTPGAMGIGGTRGLKSTPRGRRGAPGCAFKRGSLASFFGAHTMGMPKIKPGLWHGFKCKPGASQRAPRRAGKKFVLTPGSRCGKLKVSIKTPSILF